ncbi:hypothetical protein CARUB_v10025436mg, partial [Capsella rubella]
MAPLSIQYQNPFRNNDDDAGKRTDVSKYRQVPPVSRYPAGSPHFSPGPRFTQSSPTFSYIPQTSPSSTSFHTSLAHVYRPSPSPYRPPVSPSPSSFRPPVCPSPSPYRPRLCPSPSSYRPPVCPSQFGRGSFPHSNPKPQLETQLMPVISSTPPPPSHIYYSNMSVSQPAPVYSSVPSSPMSSSILSMTQPSPVLSNFPSSTEYYSSYPSVSNMAPVFSSSPSSPIYSSNMPVTQSKPVFSSLLSSPDNSSYSLMNQSNHVSTLSLVDYSGSQGTQPGHVSSSIPSSHVHSSMLSSPSLACGEPLLPRYPTPPSSHVDNRVSNMRFSQNPSPLPPLVPVRKFKSGPTTISGVKRRAGKEIDPRTRHYQNVPMDSCFNDMIKTSLSPQVNFPVDGNGGYSSLKSKTYAQSIREIESHEDKKKKRLLANRESAARSKERKDSYVASLERRIMSLQSEYNSLYHTVTVLEKNKAMTMQEIKQMQLRIQYLEDMKLIRDEISMLKGESTLSGQESVDAQRLKEAIVVNQQMSAEIE